MEKDFDRVLEMVDMNNGLDKEIEETNTSLPEFMNDNCIAIDNNYSDNGVYKC